MTLAYLSVDCTNLVLALLGVDGYDEVAFGRHMFRNACCSWASLSSLAQGLDGEGEESLFAFDDRREDRRTLVFDIADI